MVATGRFVDEFHFHVHAFFKGHRTKICDFDEGPIQTTVPRFHVLEVEPGPAFPHWVYVSVGASRIEHPDQTRLEFVATVDKQSPFFVGILAMTTYYHSTEVLGLRHTFGLGGTWDSASSLDAAYVSLPYPWGPKLEVFQGTDVHAHVYWLMPITEAERAYATERGAESLESLFEDKSVEYWNLGRASLA